MKKTGNPADAVACDALADKATGKLNLVYFGDAEGAAYDAFMAAAKNPSVEKFAFWTTSADCAGDYGVTAPGIAIIKTFDEPKVAYSGDDWENDKVIEWMNGHITPTIFEFSDDYIEPIFANRNNAIILFSEDKDAAYQAVFAEAANSLKGKILFSTSGVSSGI